MSLILKTADSNNNLKKSFSKHIFANWVYRADANNDGLLIVYAK